MTPTHSTSTSSYRINNDQPREGHHHHHPRVVSPDLDAYIEGIMREWHAPGLAVAIVDGDKTWAKGHGYAVLNNSTPLTPHTLFYTGSTTKSFTAAAHLVEVLAGTRLGAFLRDRLWAPTGMDETYFSLAGARRSGLVLASEYYYDPVRGGHVELPHEPSSGEEGAGSVVSTVLDYAKYLRVMVEEAAPLSAAGHRELKTPRSFVVPSSKPPYTGPTTYAFGWNTAVFEGEQVYFHAGAVTMFIAAMMMIPSKKVAVAVFTNSDNRVPHVVAHHVLWEHLGVPKRKRFDLNKQLKSEMADQLEYLQHCAESIYPSLPDPPYLPTLPAADHIGSFFDPGYGTLTVDLHCDDDDDDDDSKACGLQVLGVGGEGFAYLQPAVYLEPMSGNYWLGRGYVGGDVAKEVGVPSFCVPVEFRVDVHGTVTHLGIGVRLEGDDGPLT
ncbi:Serine beta-lactamase-like protein LACTB, partial [Colletotrichum shisoi]